MDVVHVRRDVEAAGVDRRLQRAAFDEAHDDRGHPLGRQPAEGLRLTGDQRAGDVGHEAPVALPRGADPLYPDYRRRIAARGVPVLSVAVLARRDGVESLGAELAGVQEEEPAARLRSYGRR